MALAKERAVGDESHRYSHDLVVEEARVGGKVWVCRGCGLRHRSNNNRMWRMRNCA